jgi:hypothetical protein
MHEDGTPLLNFFQKMSPLQITDALDGITSTMHMQKRMVARLTNAVLPESESIAEKAERSQETVQVAA